MPEPFFGCPPPEPASAGISRCPTEPTLKSYKTLPVKAFIGRLIRHIPDKHFKMVRHAGIFAPRWKQRYLAQARQALGQPAAGEQAPEPVPRPCSLTSWQERREAQGTDPLRCSQCGEQMILLGTVFGAHAAIERWFERAGRPTKPFHPAWSAPG